MSREKRSTAAHRTQIAKAKTQNPESKQSPTNTSGLPFTPTSEPRIQNPESGIQTPAALMNPRAWRDIRTQNPESGIRKPASRTCASVQGKSEPRTRIPETGFGFLILGFHTCWRGPCNDYQNPESKNPKFPESIWILGGAIHVYLWHTTPPGRSRPSRGFRHAVGYKNRIHPADRRIPGARRSPASLRRP